MVRIFRRRQWAVGAATLLCIMACSQVAAIHAGESTGSNRKKIVFIPGPQSHGWTGHAYTADCKLLAQILNENVPAVEAVVLDGGWPVGATHASPLQDAAAIVNACDGNGLLGSESNWKALDEIAKKGVGIAYLHYALDPGKEYGKYLLNWIGGYYEQFWSVNPGWRADFKTLPNHPITRGVKPFQVEDEWYYHMRFVEDMAGVTPVLTAVPPNSTRKGKDGPHSGNPEVRKRTGMQEVVGWAYERPNGGRGFGFTGMHTHWNWAQDSFRKAVLNAIVWIAKAEVPQGGVPSKTPTLEELEADLGKPRPANFNPDPFKKMIEQFNR
jgi:type 1 glutamine amidotransferase